MHGLPRSGKSTIAKRLSQDLHAPIVNQDAIRLALHGHAYETAAEPMVKTIADYMIRALFEAGHKVVIADETHYSRAARDHRKSDKWRTVFYEVPTSIEVCKERAIATDQAYLLPVLDEMTARHEPLGEDEERTNGDWRGNPALNPLTEA
jgi:predicted kinase